MDSPDPAAWRAAVGGQFETASHGLLDLAVRRGPFSVTLFTDTLDVRLAPMGQRGRWEIGLRGAAFAGGMWITPWSDGAPDPTRAQRASYVGPDARIERWLGHGTYVAADGWARVHLFEPLGDATLDVPDQLWVRGDAVAGYWGDRADIALKFGVDLQRPLDGALPSRVSPHLRVDGHVQADGRVAPIGEVHLVWAENQDDVVATRLGGMTPYNPPVSGASWAEWWVEDLAMTRIGVAYRPSGIVTVDLVGDIAAFDVPEDSTIPVEPRPWAVGAGPGASVAKNGWFATVRGGVAPWIRDGGAPSVAVYTLLGTDWRPFRRPE